MSNFAAFIDLAERTAAQHRWLCAECTLAALCPGKFQAQYERDCQAAEDWHDEQDRARAISRGTA